MTPFKTRCLSTALNSATNILQSYRHDPAARFPFSRRWLKPSLSLPRIQGDFPPALVYHRALRPPAPVTHITKQFHTTLRQTVIHQHSFVQKTLYQRVEAAGHWRQDLFFLLLPQRTGGAADPAAQPVRAARVFLRIFSGEGARRELLPFYSGVVRSVLREEQERYKSRPSQAVSLIWTLFGRPNAFRTLTRFYLSAAQKLGSSYFPALNSRNTLFLAAGIVLHSRLYRQYVRQLWDSEAASIPLRYAVHERTVTSGLLRFPAAPPSREVIRRLIDSAGETRPAPEPLLPRPQPEVRLSEDDFQALVRDVAYSLNRRSRLERLQKGGI